MKRAFRIAVFVLLLTARDGSQVIQERPLPRGLPRPAAGVTERRPVGIRLNLSVTPADLGLSDDPYARAVANAEAAPSPVYKVHLLNSEHFSADWRGGRIEYRIEGFNPLGGSLGGQLSTNTAKITLSWSSAN